MKSIIFTVFMAVCCCGMVTAQGDIRPAIDQVEIKAPASGAIMAFENMTVDYGSIKQHGEPLRIVNFTNTGTEPLIIKNARGSCGCTVPVWPKEPIMPGESNVIEIRYDTKRLGKFNKTVTFTTNEEGDPHVLKVTGHISKADSEESVPTAPTSIIKDVAPPVKKKP